MKSGWLATAGGLALVLIVQGSGRAGLPLYDGLPLPQPAYRYVLPPKSLVSSNQEPLAAETQLGAREGKVLAGALQTGDRQMAASFAVGALSTSPEVQSVRIRVEPDRAPPPPPAGAIIHGNVYRVSATTQPAGAPVRVERPFQIALRFPPGPFQELQWFDGSDWHPLRTERDRSNPYARAALPGLGEVAATAPPGARDVTFFEVLARVLEGYGVVAAILIFSLVAITHEIRRRGRKG